MSDPGTKNSTDDNQKPNRSTPTTDDKPSEPPKVDLTKALGRTAGETLDAHEHDDSAPVLDDAQNE